DIQGAAAQASAVIKVRKIDDRQAPTADFDNITNGQVLHSLTDIRAHVADSNLDSYRLEIALQGAEFVEIASGGEPVAGAVLASLDPRSLVNGFYQLRLTATDMAG